MKGLEITVRPLSELFTEHLFLRLDSEFCQKAFLKNVATIRAWPAGWTKLGTELADISGGATPLGADYCEDGVQFLRVQNVMPNYIDAGDMAFISDKDDAELERSRLREDDVLLTITGVSYGKSAVVTPAFVDGNINQHSVRMALKPGRIRPYFLSTFLNSAAGKMQSDQNVTGGTRPALDYATIRNFSVPLLSDAFQAKIEAIIKEGHGFLDRAAATLATGEQTLLRALGLENWQPPEPLTYTRRASEVGLAHRIDAEYFAPRVADLLKHLGLGGQAVRDVAPARCENFVSGGPGEFDYLEIGAVHSDGTITGERLPRADAPSRATWRVRAGDVVTSTVRPLRRLSAIIAPEQDGFVASSGFLVLQPQEVPAEVLLTFLRLPPVCGLMDLHTSASLYPAISERNLLNLPFPKLPAKTCDAIVQAVRAAHTARRKAQELLAKAQRAVEIAIVQDEKSALAYLGC